MRLQDQTDKAQKEVQAPRETSFPGSQFKKRPCGPVLKASQQNPPAPGAPRGWVSATLVPAAACHFEDTKIRRANDSFLLQRQVFSRGLSRKMLPLAGEFRPPRRATRRCPPWTRTGLMSGDRKANRYWALGFGHGAAPAETSPAPVRQRQGNRSALHPSGLQADTIHPAHR